jgi:hypothetical protein
MKFEKEKWIAARVQLLSLGLFLVRDGSVQSKEAMRKTI